MAKPKLKLKTMEQALSVCEQELAEAKVAINQLGRQRDGACAALRVQADKARALVAKLKASNDALEWALVLAQAACRQREQELQELRQQPGDKLALAG